MMKWDNDSSTDKSTLVTEIDTSTRSSSTTGWVTRRPQTETSTYDLKHHAANPDVSIRLGELTINKLGYDSVGLVGRETELQTLEGCLKRMMAAKQSQSDPSYKEIIFLGGLSGVGKSLLAYSLKPAVEKSGSGFFVRGKFDLNRVDDPYSAFATAFGELCLEIKNACDVNIKKGAKSRRTIDPEVLKTISASITQELGSEVGLLKQLIPELELLVPSSSIDELNRIDDNFNFEAGQERWKYSIRTLTRILSLHFSPIVFAFDDLQWSDEASLDLIDILISDVQNPSPLMIIGSYRSNEVDEEHLLRLNMKNLEARKETLNYNFTDIELGNLPLDDVHKIVATLLCSSDDDGTRGLAEICLKRTLGNPFFVIEFMTMLQQELLLEYNLGLLKWVWDESRIEKETMSTENVVELLLSRMNRLPLDVQQLLQFAACLGSKFKLSTLDHIWRKHPVSSEEGPPQKIESLLAVVQEGNFIESCGSDEFRWVHDNIQEVELSLGNASEDAFQFGVGTALYQTLNEAEIDELVFEVANLINKGKVKGRVEFAKLNLKAAEKARTLSAFHSATRYIAYGINFLPNDAWISNRDLTLRLYSIGAEMELAVGRTEEMEAYMQAVLDRIDLATVDKFPLHMSKVYKLCTVDLKYNETIEYCLTVLQNDIFQRVLASPGNCFSNTDHQDGKEVYEGRIPQHEFDDRSTAPGHHVVGPAIDNRLLFAA